MLAPNPSAQVADYYRLIDLASDAMNEGRHAEAIPLFREALARDPDDPMVRNAGSRVARHKFQDRRAYGNSQQKSDTLNPDGPGG